MSKKQIITSIIGACIVIASIIGSVIFLVSQMITTIDSGQLIKLPTDETITLDDPGTYIIYHEHRSSYNGKVYNQPSGIIDGLELTLYPGSFSHPVKLSPPTLSSTYSLGGNRAGSAIFQFTINDSGHYRIRGEFSNQEDKEVIINIQKSIFKNIGGIVGQFLLLFFGGIAIGTLLIIMSVISLIKSNKHKKG